ncbi:MAG: dihydrofolate reductase family protein [Bacteroidota bacterium]|nr:dihydrofolate reductase family protein [Bacteroidota bacterium]MDX5429577.1 dihydrofolate reductase family protein [Bacteroidota bacterium]MDX5468361.1 dihydrofolate reductase family protein [Bacteroidota bacterium]
MAPITLRPLKIYISMSLDGYLADENDSLDFLSAVHQEGEDYGYGNFTAEVDTYLVGRRTYDVVKNLCGGSFPPAEKFKCYVITRQEHAAENNVTFYSGDLKTLVDDLKSQEGKTIYCDGGGQLVRELLNMNVVDELIISVIPILLGSGKPLFLASPKIHGLELLSTKPFSSGLVQLHYRVNHP